MSVACGSAIRALSLKELSESCVTPVGFAFEWIQSPLKGSKEFFIYTPHGKRTGIGVHAETTSRARPPSRLKSLVERMLRAEFNEGASVIRDFARSM